jgi:N-acetylmuramoyl-L-alanine amidase
MIGLAFAALQLAAASPPLVIRDARHSVSVPVVASGSGPMLRPDALGVILPITVHRDSGSFYTLEIWGAHLQVEPGVAIVRSGADVYPLATAPAIMNGHLMIPLQMVSEVFPGVVPNTRWDAEQRQLVVLSAPGQTAASEAVPALSPSPAKPGRSTIIVDAGHGGVDNGMTGPLHGGPRIYEKNITLAVAKKLGEQLKTRGVEVVYTRTTDTLIALDDRGRIANRAQGDLFISIHVNAANPNWKDPGGSRGFETYFLSEARTEDARRVEQMENESVQYESGSAAAKDDPLSFIVNDMAQNEHLRESSELAATIQQRLAKMHPGPSRGVKQAGFRVLVTAYMPAVLVEIGFGTNPKDAAFISDPAKQDAIAAAVADAAMAYLSRYEGRKGAGGDPTP